MLFRYRIYKNSYNEYYVHIQQKKSQEKLFWWKFKHISLNILCRTLSSSFKDEPFTTDPKAVLSVMNRYESLDNMIYKYICQTIKEYKEYKLSEENKAKETLDAIANGKWSNVIEINIEEIRNDLD